MEGCAVHLVPSRSGAWSPHPLPAYLLSHAFLFLTFSYFGWFILLAIVLNCITLALYDPNADTDNPTPLARVIVRTTDVQARERACRQWGTD